MPTSNRAIPKTGVHFWAERFNAYDHRVIQLHDLGGHGCVPHDLGRYGHDHERENHGCGRRHDHGDDRVLYGHDYGCVDVHVDEYAHGGERECECVSECDRCHLCGCANAHGCGCVHDHECACVHGCVHDHAYERRSLGEHLGVRVSQPG